MGEVEKFQSNKSVSFFCEMLFTLLPNISTRRRVIVNWVWPKNMMYNKSGFAGD
jgi:hypothetical protein